MSSLLLDQEFVDMFFPIEIDVRLKRTLTSEERSFILDKIYRCVEYDDVKDDPIVKRLLTGGN